MYNSTSAQITGKCIGWNQHKKYVPQSVAQMKLCATFVAQMWHKMWHNLGCMGENQYKYRKYVPQNVAQKTICHKCHKCGTKCGTIGGIGKNLY